MDSCNVRLMSYISAGVNMVVLAIMSVLMIFLMVVHQDKGKAEENKQSGIVNFKFQHLVYLEVASVVGFFCSILLVQGIRLNRMKFVYYYFWPIGLLLIGWTLVTLHALIASLGARKPFRAVFIEFSINLIFLVVEGVLLIPIVMLYKQMKAQPFTIAEQQALRRNEPYKPSFHS